MKLVDRHELMKMPEGTIYQSWTPCILGPLMFKGETCTTEEGENIDWFENNVGADTYDHERQFELNNSMCREGCFDEDTRYLVHDANDIELIIRKLKGESIPIGVTLKYKL
jgi:hypothetical protein